MNPARSGKRLLVVATLLLALLALVVFSWQRATTVITPEPARADVHADANAHAAEAAPAGPGIPAVGSRAGAAELPTVASILASSPSLAAGFQRALAHFGPQDPELVSALSEAASECSRLEETAGAGDPAAEAIGPGRDPLKVWAVDKLRLACRDFDAGKYLALVDRSQVVDPLNALIKGGPAAQLASARAVIGHSRDRFALVNAGRVLLLDDEAFVRELFAGQLPSRRLEQTVNWNFASSLATCARQLGCGADSLSTLGYCVEMGCQPGVDLRQALAGSLSARDYRQVLAFSAWLDRRR